MKKNLVVIFSFFISLLLSVLTIFLVDLYYTSEIDKNINSDKSLDTYNNNFCYERSDERDNSIEIMHKILKKENNILLLGSSELSASDNIGYPPVLFNYGNSNFNMVMSGSGYVQSLLQAIKLGAYEPLMKNRKVVLILSPQWFTTLQAQGDKFDSKWLTPVWTEFINNKNISYNLKNKIKSRAYKLSKDGGDVQNAISETEIPQDSHAIAKSKKSISTQSKKIFSVNWASNRLDRIRRNIAFSKQIKESRREYDKSLKSNKKIVKVEKINFKTLMKRAEEQGKLECTNNDFGIYDEYFDTYVKSALAERKNSEKEMSYSESDEYYDLKLFLEVAEEANLKVMLVSMPVNGRWSDYTGFLKKHREDYYKKIRKIAKQYKVEIADFSDKEYELYFLRDIMHCGWKGWVYIDEAVYKFNEEDKK